MKKFRDIFIGIVIGALVTAGIYMIPQARGADCPQGMPFTAGMMMLSLVVWLGDTRRSLVMKFTSF